ncbi:UNVERIFIED_CONTAM: hypothetical protein NCL1_17959 [Trichonephila clavipes]
MILFLLNRSMHSFLYIARMHLLGSSPKFTSFAVLEKVTKCFFPLSRGHFSSACIRNENRAATFHFNHVFEFCFPKDSSPAAGLTRVESCGDQRTSVSGINREQPIPCSGYLVKSGL